MESAWEEFADEFTDHEEMQEVCPLYKTQHELFRAGDEVLADDRSERLLEEHGGSKLLAFNWKASRGLPVYAFLDETKSEACRMDHVKEEHMMTFTVPMKGTYPQDRPFDRNLLPPYQWAATDELQTLRQLLLSQSEFVQLQVLSCLKEWASASHIKKFTNEPEMAQTVANLMLESSNCGIMRMAACVISLMAKQPKLRDLFLKPDGPDFLGKFLSLVNGQTKIKDEGCRWLITKALAEMTTSDLAFTGYLIRKYSLELLFNSLNNSTNTFFKINLLTLLYNLHLHPLGLESLTSQEDFTFVPILKAMTSLVPKYHRAGFQLLDLILRPSREPLQSKLHSLFVAEGGLLTIVALLEEVLVLDKKVAMNCLILLDHLADGEVGQRALLTVALNLLRSIIYFKNPKLAKASLKSLAKKKEGSVVTSTKSSKKPKTISETVSKTVAESKAIDGFNAPESKTFSSPFMPMEESFFEEASNKTAFGPQKRPHSGGKKASSRPTPSPSISVINSSMSVSGRASVRVVAKALERRIKKRTTSGHRGLLEMAALCVEKPEALTADNMLKVENNIRSISMEVVSKLARHPLGAKLLIGLVRNLCPLLKRHTKDTGIAESVCFCLQLLFTDNYAELVPLLNHYYVMRELATCLNQEMGDRAKASLIGAVAVLLKQSCRLVYTLAGFSIRKPLLYWLRLAPEYTPDYTTLYTLMTVYCLARFYKRRDFLMCKTVVQCLINILQNNATEEQCRIYAALSLSFLTLANRRYRKLGSDAFSVEREELLFRYSVDVSFLDLDDDDSDEEEPSPTLDSFKSTKVEESFFQQVCEKGPESPANFFYMFLLQILIKRATPIWENIVLANFKPLMDWLRKCLDEKRSMSRYFYRTLMESLPSLCFYFHSTVETQIDQQPFYVCVDEDRHGSFTDFLQLEGEVCPRYTVYKLDKEEEPTTFPWDKYWKERTEPSVSSPYIARSTKSVLLDSIFGFGSYYSDNPNLPLLMTTVLPKKNRGPFFGPRPVVDYDLEEVVEHEPIPRFNPCASPLVSKRGRKGEQFSKRFLQTRQTYIANLTGTSHGLTKDELLDKAKYFTIPRTLDKLTREKIFATINDFFKNPIKNYSFRQFKLLTEALTSPPKAWLDFINESNDATSPNRALFKRIQSWFPNTLLRDIGHVFFHEGVTRNNLEILFDRSDIYKEAAYLVTCTIISAFERHSGKRFSYIPYEKSDEEKQKLMMNKGLNDRPLKRKSLMARYTSILKKSSVVSNELSEWSNNLAAYGRAFLDFFGKSLTDSTGRALMKYYLEESDIYHAYKQRRSSNLKSKAVHLKTRDSSLKDFSSTKSDGRLKTDAQENESETKYHTGSVLIPDADMNRKSKRMTGLTSYGSSHNTIIQNSASKIKSKVTIDEVYVPTKREITIDFFTQPGEISFRRPFSRDFCYSRSNSRFIGHMTESLFNAFSRRLTHRVPEMPEQWSDFKNMFNSPIYRKVCNLIVREHATRIRNIDYESANQRADMEIGTVHNSFQMFRELIMNEILNVLKKVTRSSCWYRDIIKIIATNVCNRLEGPFGYVTDYLVLQHRNQLKWRLGTTVIPMGLLRIGGQLERAILFKFFADQLMIPCRLHRYSLTEARAEVPLNPFQQSENPSFGSVDLDKSPGKIVKTCRKSAEERGGGLECLISNAKVEEDDLDDKIIRYLDMKGYLNVFSQRPTVQTEPSCYSLRSSHYEEEEEEEEQSDERISQCSSPLDWDVFSQYSSDFEPESPPRESHMNSRVIQSLKEEANSKPQINDKIFRKYCWRSDTSGRYTTITGRVPDTAVVGGSRAPDFSRLEVEYPCQSDEYSWISMSELRAKLIQDTNPFKTNPLSSDEEKYIDVSDIEGLFPQWMDVLQELSVYEMNKSPSSEHTIKT